MVADRGGKRTTYQNCAEHSGADAFSDLILPLLIGPCEVVFSSRAKHPERHQPQYHLLQQGSAEAVFLFLSIRYYPTLLQCNLKAQAGTCRLSSLGGMHASVNSFRQKGKKEVSLCGADTAEAAGECPSTPRTCQCKPTLLAACAFPLVLPGMCLPHPTAPCAFTINL